MILAWQLGLTGDGVNPGLGMSFAHNETTTPSGSTSTGPRGMYGCMGEPAGGPLMVGENPRMRLDEDIHTIGRSEDVETIAAGHLTTKALWLLPNRDRTFYRDTPESFDGPFRFVEEQWTTPLPKIFRSRVHLVWGPESTEVHKHPAYGQRIGDWFWWAESSTGGSDDDDDDDDDDDQDDDDDDQEKEDDEEEGEPDKKILPPPEEIWSPPPWVYFPPGSFKGDFIPLDKEFKDLVEGQEIFQVFDSADSWLQPERGAGGGGETGRGCGPNGTATKGYVVGPNDHAFGAFMGKGTPNSTNSPNLCDYKITRNMDRSVINEWNRVVPLTSVLRPYYGYSNNQWNEPVYFQDPNTTATQYRSGTGPGGFWFHQPEIDLSQVRDRAGVDIPEITNNEISITDFGFAPGTRLYFGYPNLDNGDIDDGFAFSLNSSTELLGEIVSSGTASSILTMPNSAALPATVVFDVNIDAANLTRGTGSPEGSEVGRPGDLFQDTDATGALWLKVSGTDTSTLWEQVNTGAGGGDPDQNLWETITADSGGSAVANTTTDTLTLAGAGNIATARSGDTITITDAGQTKQQFTPSTADGVFGNFPTLSVGTSGGTAKLLTTIPADASTLTEASILLVPVANNATIDIDVAIGAGAVSEDRDTHTGNDTTSTYNLVQFEHFNLDILSILNTAGVSAGDRLSVGVVNNDGSDVLHLLGIEIIYTT